MIHQSIQAEIPVAMKAKDQIKLDTLRGLTTAFVNELVATKRKPDSWLDDESALTVIRREVKKRKEAAEAFLKGGRIESADKERIEQVILEAYLPALLDETSVRALVEAKKAELGVTDKKDMGRLMGSVMKELAGKADGAVVQKIVVSLF